MPVGLLGRGIRPKREHRAVRRAGPHVERPGSKPVRVLIVQPAPGVPPHRTPYREEVALLGAATMRRRWPTGLTVFRSYDASRLAAAIQQAAPDVACIYVDGLSADLAFRIADGLRADITAPLLLFGPHARRCPDECLSRAGVEAVCIGPADVCLPAYLETSETDPGRLQAPGMWINCKTGVMRNPPPPPPTDPADQPAPARALYGLESLLDAAGFAPVGLCRGGESAGSEKPARAAAAAPSRSTPWPVLHRPVEAVCREMAHLAQVQIDLVGFRLTNTRWTASAEWVKEFTDRYVRTIRLPVRTTLEPRDVTSDVAETLTELGCEEVRIRVGSGSPLIRNDILQIGASNAELEAAFGCLAAAGVPTAASVEIGAAYETEVTLGETLDLLRSLRPDRVEAKLHYPEPGTAAFEAARDSGLLVGNPAAAYLAGRPALALPNLSEEQLVTAVEALPYSVLRPRTGALIRLARGVKCGKGRTLHELVVKPFLGPPVRRRRRR